MGVGTSSDRIVRLGHKRVGFAFDQSINFQFSLQSFKLGGQLSELDLLGCSVIALSHKQVVACDGTSAIYQRVLPLQNDLLNVASGLVIPEPNWWVRNSRYIIAHLCRVWAFAMLVPS